MAEAGCNVVAIADDAYFGLFYEDSLKESLFGKLANLHPRILAIKLDGATKEEFVWGFRTGFITFADGKKLFFGPPAGTGDGGTTPAVKVP